MTDDASPFEKARRRFAAFHERLPRREELRQIAMRSPETVLTVGELVGVIYKAAGDGKQYIHRFRKDARPVLTVSSDGTQIYALAGAYRFTERGFVDRKRRK